MFNIRLIPFSDSTKALFSTVQLRERIFLLGFILVVAKECLLFYHTLSSHNHDKFIFSKIFIRNCFTYV